MNVYSQMSYILQENNLLLIVCKYYRHVKHVNKYMETSLLNLTQAFSKYDGHGKQLQCKARKWKSTGSVPCNSKSKLRSINQDGATDSDVIRKWGIVFINVFNVFSWTICLSECQWLIHVNTAITLLQGAGCQFSRHFVK